ncbi:AMP-dependent synthetase/ligase [Desulfatitalea alkaliphila]|uniref:Long-chain fatty acid--CoA ligase n=1 Tax=Desulfatitalea alkaliphila TaxID=2929485 RepID=A0AA41R3R8_9BACT|nr:long-chain fatty acid--CoA ligase [Desulfatitalea alkaliphila]MCJ8502697.1 long-chain fatty acid--CoA ligase [Desulfatitalea alkaliphila]
MTIETLPKALLHIASTQPERVALRRKEFGIWRDITWAEYLRKVKYTALGLHALGLSYGEHVSIIGENRPEWLYSALGAVCAGGAWVGIYTTNPAPECEYVVTHSDAVFYICEDEEQLDKALVFREKTPKLRRLIVWEMEGLKHFQDPMLMSFAQLLELGEATDKAQPELFQQLIEQVKPQDTAGIIYTSGTTGPPKGAMLSHENYLWVGQAARQVMYTTRDDETISFLPLNHVYEQIFDIMFHLTVGHTVNFTESTDTVMADMRDVSPTVFHAVPRIWEKYYSAIVLKMADATWIKRTLYNMAIKIGTQYNNKALAKQSIPVHLTLAYHLFYFVVFRKLKKRLGFDRIRFGGSGAAPISHEILKFFQSIGIPIREGYGMTETTGVTHMSDERNFKVGTVGRALPETEVRIAEDGEIVVRHKGIFKGYYKDPEKTAEVLNDGWLHTGDVGEIDDEGYLKLTDRKKDLIITAGGKNIAPQFLENLLKFSPYINDAVVIGDRRKYLTAIIVIDEENVTKYAQDQKVQFTTFATMTKAPEIVDLIQQEVDKVNRQVARVENIRKFRILDKKLYTEDGEVTPTMKVKRKSINEQYKDLIESMYAA